MNALMTPADVLKSVPLLDVAGLCVDYGPASRPVHAIRDVSFALHKGEALGLIGESGSGKSTVAFALMRHVKARVTADRLQIGGRDLLTMSDRELASIRGRRVAMVYQNPMSALNPVMRIGDQIAEVLRHHRGATSAQAQKRTIELLDRVHLPDPRGMAQRFPHQLSGGQQQRVVIAMAIACDPELLIMDEPTTGLDVTTEAVILDLVNELRRELDAAILFISHNLAVVGTVCDRVGVLYAGEFMETGRTSEVLRRPAHPYTLNLIDALPGVSSTGRLRAIPGHLPDLRDVPPGCIFRDRCDSAVEACATRPALAPVETSHLSRCHLRSEIIVAPRMEEPETLPVAADSAPDLGKQVRLRVSGLSKSYGGSRLPFLNRAGAVKAVSDVSFDIPVGKTLALVGESGSGKSTLARCIAGLTDVDSGTIELDGASVAATVEKREPAQREGIQFIFQNPDGALNPHQQVQDIVARPLKLYGKVKPGGLVAQVRELLATVKLSERYRTRRPRDLSGGEKQRVGIARAFAATPKLVICDEPTSALDVSVQAAILNELNDLQARSGTSYLFISHDLGVVRYIADRVAILYLGRIVEVGTPEEVFSAPHHPYTEVLVAAIPRLDAPHNQARPKMKARAGAPSRGCVFQARCLHHQGRICEEESPPQQMVGEHAIACHIAADTLARMQAPAAPRSLAKG